MGNLAFRTIELSYPRFEKDGLRFITVKSKQLKGRGDICVFIPEGMDANASLPVVILLHGVYGSAWSWAFNGGVHLTAARLMGEGKIPPMILAMPSDGLWGDGSAYLPHHGLDFEKWIGHDVPAVLSECFSAVNNDSAFFISGLSMGGFGAMKIGVKYHRFKAVSAHSSLTHLEQMSLFAEEDLQNYRQADPVEEDVFQTIRKHRDQLPKLRFDCGTEDELLPYNRRLHDQLTAAGIEHFYEEFPGGHQWAYWEQHVQDSLLFFAKNLRP
jgi:putative tributyrin esterase